MSEISVDVGKRIRNYRTQRNLTLTDLSEMIGKSPSTISKYENGQISIDIETLYDLAKAFSIHVEQLLHIKRDTPQVGAKETIPAFFKNVVQFYSYSYDGRNNKLMRCVYDVSSQLDTNKFNIMLYMNYENFDKYQICENIYHGTIEHFDAVTNIHLTNQDTPMERASIQILASYLDASTKWGLWTGLSSRPMMPVATKMLYTRERLVEDQQLIETLKISKEDIRLMKLFNMFSV